MKRLFPYIVAFALAGGLLPTAALAQITGTVRTGTGVPLESASVEAWLDGARVAATLTDEDGDFALRVSASGGADELRVGALGFQTRTVAIRSGVTAYQVTLEEEPLLLEGLEVVLEGDVCRREDDATARYLWNSARAHYHQALDTLGIATYLSEADTIVRREDIGPLRLPDLALNQRSSGSILRFSWGRRIDREGYAFKVRRTDGQAAFDSWVYPPLEADFAPHFVGEQFGDLHRLVDPVQDDDGWTFTFCPRYDDQPGIRGTFSLAPDTTLAAVEWSFLTPEPVERAGGRAVFPSLVKGAEDVYPLPVEALIWRQVPDGRYFQLYQRYEGWKVVPGDSVPQLPLRKDGGTQGG